MTHPIPAVPAGADERAIAEPLLEKLRSVPLSAVLRIDTPNALGCMDTRSIPVGRLCFAAADELAAWNRRAVPAGAADLQAVPAGAAGQDSDEEDQHG